jgi:hypothetical protein
MTHMRGSLTAGLRENASDVWSPIQKWPPET